MRVVLIVMMKHQTMSTVTSNNAEQTRTFDNNFNLPVETYIHPIDMRQYVLDSNKTLCIAPSEGQKPQNIFQENGSDAMAFPTLFPKWTLWTV